MELVSVILPVYNSAKYLNKCIESIINQTYSNLEIVVVDDGSTDNSLDICRHYAAKDKRIVVITKENEGISVARNTGIEAAKGKYLMFIDSDDYYENTIVEKLFNDIQEYKADISCCNFYIIDKKGASYKPIIKDKCITEISSRRAICLGFNRLGFLVWNKLYKRELFNGVKFPPGQLFEDISAIYKIYLNAKKIIVRDEPLYYYNCVNFESLTKKTFSLNKLDYFKATEELLGLANIWSDKELIKIIKEERAYHICGFLRQMIDINFDDPNVIDPLIAELRKNIFFHLTGRHKLNNKLFGLCAIFNFSLTKKIYKNLYR